MAGFESVQSKIKKIGEKAQAVQQGRRVSVVYMNDDGSIDWPENPAAGVLVVPRPMTEEEWEQRYGQG